MKTAVFSFLLLLSALILHAQVISVNPLHHPFDSGSFSAHASFPSIQHSGPDTFANKFSKNTLIQPLFAADVWTGTQWAYSAAGGCKLQSNKKKKWTFDASVYSVMTKLPAFLGEKFDSMSVLPGSETSFYNHNSKKAAVFFPCSFSYQLNKTFAVQIGNGRTFLGNGYRSVLLSDQSAEYPYIRISADINKIKYLHQIARWRQQTPFNTHETKYAATHYLSWMISPKLNLSLFESVIWKANDSVRTRGFEWLYLNPVLFFRPAEFSIGSPDNMLIGGNVSWTFHAKSMVYAQVLLDEFFIAEIKNGIRHLLHPNDASIPFGAWVNKHAFQLGIKTNNILGLQHLSLLAETNIARPYVWSHRDPMLSNAHQNQPLTHPLGANFIEFLFRAQYSMNKWMALFQSQFYSTGLDSTGTHFGQNILQSTFDGDIGGNIPVQYYGNTVAQGVSKKVFQWSLEIKHMLISKENKIMLRFGALYRKNIGDLIHPNEYYLFGGVFLNLNPASFDFR